MYTINIEKLIEFLTKNYEVECYSKEVIHSEEFAALYKEDLCDNYQSELVYVAKILTNEKYLYDSPDGSRLLFVYSVDGINISKYHILGGDSILMQILESDGNFENIEPKLINADSDSDADADDWLSKEFVLNDDEIVKYIGNERIVYIPMFITKIGNEAFANKTVEVIHMTNEVIEIGDKAFYNCHKLKKIKLPNMLKSIGERAFSNCYKLKNVFLSNTITSIGDGAFSECSKIKRIKIPSKISIIPKSLCFTCLRLKKIEFHERVYEINEDAFMNCDNIKKISLPQDLLRIGGGAFMGVKIKELIVPATVKVMGESCFARCEKLSRVCINEKTIIENNVFRNSEKARIEFSDNKNQC